MARHVALGLCLAVAGCAGRRAGPAAPTPRSAPAAAHAPGCRDEPPGAEFPCGVDATDTDCAVGPGATTFEAEYEGDPAPLWVNACDPSRAGPVQVITVDGHILAGTAAVDSELDASYHVVASGYRRPGAGGVDALIVVPASARARIVALSTDDLGAIGAALARAYGLPTTVRLAPPTPIVAVDVDGDGRGDAAVVQACARVAGDRCAAVSRVFVRRDATSWNAPHASPR